MATLYIAECSAIGGGGNHPISGAQFPPIHEQVVAIGAGALESTAFNKNCTLLRLNCDVACSIVISPSSSVVHATTANARLAANQTEFISVPQNSGYLISVIGNS